MVTINCRFSIYCAFARKIPLFNWRKSFYSSGAQWNYEIFIQLNHNSALHTSTSTSTSLLLLISFTSFSFPTSTTTPSPLPHSTDDQQVIHTHTQLQKSYALLPQTPDGIRPDTSKKRKVRLMRGTLLFHTHVSRSRLAIHRHVVHKSLTGSFGKGLSAYSLADQTNGDLSRLQSPYLEWPFGFLPLHLSSTFSFID